MTLLHAWDQTLDTVHLVRVPAWSLCTQGPESGGLRTRAGCGNGPRGRPRRAQLPDAEVWKDAAAGPTASELRAPDTRRRFQGRRFQGRLPTPAPRRPLVGHATTPPRLMRVSPRLAVVPWHPSIRAQANGRPELELGEETISPAAGSSRGPLKKGAARKDARIKLEGKTPRLK